MNMYFATAEKKKYHLSSPLPESDWFVERLRSYQSFVGGYLRRKRHLVVLSKMPGNVGDQLIWAGTKSLLKMENLEFDRVGVSQLEGLPEMAFGDKTLVIPGNGALTSRWNEWLPDAIKRASKIFQNVVILPSEYEPLVDSVNAALECHNVFPFARDAESYGLIKKYRSASLSLDPALWAFPFQQQEMSIRNDDNLGNVLLALRTDAGSLLSQNNLKPSGVNDDISATKAGLKEFLKSIKSADSVVSDRLHVVVAATMVGKPVRFIDPYNSKISRYVKYNFRNRFEESLQQRDEEWLLSRGYAQDLDYST